MAEVTRSRNPSSGNDPKEKEFLAKLRRINDSSQDDKANLKLKTRPLRNGSGLQVFLTRQDDPAFYYSVDIAEMDYRELQKNQGLRVDMSSFPQMIFQLLDDCIDEQGKENPKFFPVLLYSDNGGDLEITFEIQETNKYKVLAHLSLRLRKGNDAKVREHLGECLNNLRQEHTTTVKKLEETEQRLAAALNEKSSLRSHLDQQTKDTNEKDVMFKNRLAQEITEEREKTARVIAEQRMHLEAEKERLKNEYTVQSRTLQNSKAALEYDNKHLVEKKHMHEAQIKSLKEETRKLNEECERLRSEVEQHRLDKENLGQGKFEQERNMSALKTTLNVLEQEKRHLTENLKRKDETIDDLNNRQKQLDQELGLKMADVDKRKKQVKDVSKELLKANEIISKMQEENRRQNHKVKLSGDILKEQEKAIKAKEAELKDTREQLKDLKENFGHKETEANDLEKHMDELRTKTEELQKELRTSEATVQWLNKGLNTAQMRDPDFRLGPPPQGVQFSPRAMASTSTPMPRTQTPTTSKENRNPGLDPKLLQPSPVLGARNRGGGRGGASGGLLRKDLSSTKAASKAAAVSQPPQSLYFATT